MLRPDTRHDSAGSSGSAPPPRKLVIKPFKSKPQLPADFEKQTWSILQSAVRAVHNHTAASQSKEDLYRAVEDMCVHKLSANLYANLYKECESHIYQLVDSLISIGKKSDNALFLSAFDSVWRDHCDQMNTIRNIFLYLDRTYCAASSAISSNLASSGIATMNIWDFGIELFNLRMETRSSEIQSRLITSMLAQMESSRMGVAIDHEILKRLVRMLVDLGQYEHKFLVPFLKDSERFFLAEGQTMIERGDPVEFLVHAEHRLLEAINMSKSYLHISSKIPLQQVIETKLLLPHVPILVEKSVGALLNQGAGRIPDLRRLYVLLDRVDSLEILRQTWSVYMCTIGQNMLSDTSRDKTFVDDLLEFLDQMSNALRTAFSNNETFGAVLNKSFQIFLNVRQKRPAELLARFFDKKMKGERGLLDNETEAILDRAMTIFRLLEAKDTFEAFYKKLLSKRLLLRKSSDLELEKSLITRLKTECGPNYTAKLEGMFQDVDLSRDAMAAYVQHTAKLNGAGDKVAADFQVLTTGYWPAQVASDSVRLPSDLHACKDRFVAFYTQKYQGRRLVFAHALERCIIVAHFPIKKKELEVSLFQALVLVAFNKSDRLTLQEIAAATGIDLEELKRTLQSLANGLIGTRVLTKDPKGKEVGGVLVDLAFT